MAWVVAALFWGNFLFKGGGVRMLAREVCALLSSIGQCKKTSKQAYSFTIVRIHGQPFKKGLPYIATNRSLRIDYLDN